MSARLYPGFGSGKATLELHVKVNSFATVGRHDLEAGDKLLLPASAFKEISRLKLPFPLTFQLHNDKLKPTAAIPDKKGSAPPPLAEQYAGVLEFSAPEGQAYIPAWMLGNLKLREGAQIRMTSVKALPPGAYVKFRPHDTAFVDLAASIGPRELLETALRNYSVLSTGERIIIDVADTKYALDVVEVKPSGKVSLFGHVDLEVDFDPVYSAADAEKAAVKPVAEPVKAAKAVTKPASATSNTTTQTAAAAAATGKDAKALASAKAAVANKSSASATSKPQLASTQPIASAAESKHAESALSSPMRTPTKPKVASVMTSPSGHSSGAGVLWFPGLERIIDGTHGFAARELTAASASANPGSQEGVAAANEAEDVVVPDREEVARRMRIAALRRMQSQQDTPTDKTPQIAAHVESGWLSAAAATRAAQREIKAEVRSLVTQESKYEDIDAKQDDDVYDGKREDDAGDGKRQDAEAKLEEVGVDDVRCPHCHSNVRKTNIKLHMVHCKRSTDFQRITCRVCEQLVYRKDESTHFHCGECAALLPVDAAAAGSVDAARIVAVRDHQAVCGARRVRCDCGQEMSATEMALHKQSCAAVLVPCVYCKVTHKRGLLADHEARCGSRTRECEECGKLVVLKRMEQHLLNECKGASESKTAERDAYEHKLAEVEDSKEDSDPSGARVIAKTIASGVSAAAEKGGKTAKPALLTAETTMSSSLGSALGLNQSSRVTKPAAARSVAAAPSPRGGMASSRDVKAAHTGTGATATSRTSTTPAATTRTSTITAATTPKAAIPGTKTPAAATRKPISSSSHDLYPCPNCSAKCKDYEDLQMHVFTACPKSDLSGVTPAPRASVASRGSSVGATSRGRSTIAATATPASSSMLTTSKAGVRAAGGIPTAARNPSVGASSRFAKK